ncbi:MAG: hypothetical protein RIS45_419 [Planctomycetota bacterium]
MSGIVAMLPLIALAAPPAADATHRTTVQTSPIRPELEVVDQGVEDRGGFEKSLRVLPLDMRVPTGFQQVYRVPGREDLLMRGNGALFAVFPRSVYQRTPIGTIPLAPADVHFSIGMPGGFAYPGGFLHHESPAPDPRIATRVDARIRPKAAASIADDDGSAPSSADEMPAISEAPKAARSAARKGAPASAAPLRIRSLADLRLGPPVLARE